MTNNFSLQVDHKITSSFENKATVLEKMHRIWSKSEKPETKTSQNYIVQSANKAVSGFSVVASSVQEKTTNWNSDSVQKSKFFRPWEAETTTSCHLCDTNVLFRRISDLRRHLRTKHLVEAEIHHCEVCGEKFTRKDNLMRHVKTMHHNRKFVFKPKCQFCQKRLSRKDAVKRHERSCNGKDVQIQKRIEVSS